MNFTHLHAFYSVALAGSISGGAERMNVSQPAVTREIKDLELRIGSALFDRRPRGVVLTEAGQLLLRYAEQIFSTALTAERELRSLNDLSAGHLDITASGTLGVYWVPRLLADFIVNYPGITVNLAISNSQIVQSSVEAGSFGLGFVEGNYDQERFDALPLGNDEIVVVRAKYAQERPTTMTAQDVLSSKLIMREAGSGVREAVEHAFAKLEMVVAPRLCVSNTESIKRLLYDTPESLSFLSRLSVADELATDRLEIITVPELTIGRSLHVLWRKGRSLSRAATLFKKMVEHTAM